MRTNIPLLIVFCLITPVILSGCAGSAPKATYVQTPKADAKIDINDSFLVQVDAASGVDMLALEKQRLEQLIEQKINAVKSQNMAGGTEQNYEVNVTITRYKKGNAFARAMLAGLGQIKVDARVALVNPDTEQDLSVFDIKKTFAWGGIYGGTTRIEDIEPALAEGIASAVTGTTDKSEDNK